MKIDQQLILRLEELARLELSEDERTTITRDLERILDMVETLQAIDTQSIEPLTYLSEEVNVLRVDSINHQIARNQAMQNAPLTDGIYFKVPKVIDK
ncbi:MAG: Asp-tRNA(Asn)/Glu-tRNA(Gln) amidotransferase subunit GatC [Saprospiraceae bacterium]|nr:Asp-tRNA(Asn)/Glu-tRNA(Gln) amidotransferase subunit GatC [Saprospiraceae bacterium]